MNPRNTRPAANRASRDSAAAKSIPSLRPGIDTLALEPLVSMLCELRRDIPPPVLTSLVVEALDGVADLVLCEQWARDRQRLYPDAIKSAHSRHAGHSYAARRAAEYEAVA